MTQSLDNENSEVLIERAIIEAFGDSIIEFEKTLFHKYLISSGPNSLITKSQFGKHLMRMHAKGYLLPLRFQRRRAWKRLIIADFVDNDVILTETNEPIKTEPLVVVSSQEDTVELRENLVTDCKDIAGEIISRLRSLRKCGNDTDWKARNLLNYHIRKMHHALTESRGQLYNYLEENLPDLRESFEHLLETRGDDKVLLGLRVVRSA